MSNGIGQQFAARVEDLRERQGLQKGELARRAGISFTAYSQIINGHRHPRLETVADIARGLRVPVWALFAPDSLISSIQDPSLIALLANAPADIQAAVLAILRSSAPPVTKGAQ